jgi:cytidylate kinase
MNLRGTSTHVAEALVRAGHDQRIQKEREKEEPGAAPTFTIALSRQVGARATSVAREVGAHLGWAVYDRELLEQIARSMKVRVELLKTVDEKRVTSIQEWVELFLTRAPVRAGAYLRHLLDTVLALGTNGECVIVGRGAAQILLAATTLRVRLVATLEDRITAIMKELGVSRQEAARYIESTERERVRFVQEHFHKDPTDLLQYDLVLNSSRFADSECADIIVLALRQLQRRIVTKSE